MEETLGEEEQADTTQYLLELFVILSPIHNLEQQADAGQAVAAGARGSRDVLPRVWPLLPSGP